jgi:hypothetical protein
LIARRRFELDDASWSGQAVDGRRRLFAGFLQPAGLLDGRLEITADDGPDRWIGRTPVYAEVRLRIAYDERRTAFTMVTSRLAAGWG